MGENARGIVVRAAEHGDYEAVMRMSRDIYAGRDYLPREYHIILHDKRYNSFVITLNGAIVGYQTNFRLNDGETFVKVGVRVDENCRGQGLAKILEDQSEALTLKRHPGIKQVTWMTLNQSAQRNMLGKNPDIKLKYRMKNVPYNIKHSDLQQISHYAPRQVPVERISQLNLSQSLGILTNPANWKRLFPDCFFNAGEKWLIYSVDAASFREVAMKYSVSASFTEDGSTCESVAFMSSIPIQDGHLKVDVWTHGVHISPELVAAHIYFWLKYLMNVVGVKPMKCLFNFPYHVSLDELQGHLVEKLGTPVADDLFCDYDGSIVVVKDIKQ